MLIRPPLSRQPATASGIDWSQPLARGLVLAVMPHVQRNLVTGAPPLNTASGLTQLIGPSGRAAQFPGASGGFLSYPLLVGSGDMTGLAIVRFGSTASQTFLGAFPSGGGSLGNYFDTESSHITAISTSGANWTLAASSLTQATNADIVAAGRFFSGAGRDVWENGVKTGSDATVRTVTGLDRLVVGAYYGAGTDQVQMAGAEYFALWWTRALSDAEMAAIARNPWLVLAPPARRVWAKLAAGGATFTATLSASAITAAAITRAVASSKAAAATAGAAKVSQAQAKRASSSAVAAALTSIKTKLLTLLASTTAGAAVVRSTRAVRVAASSAGGSLVRLAASTKAAGSTAGAALVAIKTKLLTLLASTSAGASVVRATQAVRAAEAAVGIALVRKVSSTKAATGTVAGDVQRTVSQVRAAAATVSATVATVKAKLLTRAAGVTSSAAVQRAMGAVRAASAATAAAVGKSVRLMRMASTAGSALLGLLGGVAGTLTVTAGYVVSHVQRAWRVSGLARKWTVRK